MDPIFSLFSVGMSCLGQACCWYTVFKWCGCIEPEREVIIQQPYTHPPPVSQNPFLVQGIPRDKHLEPAYR